MVNQHAVILHIAYSYRMMVAFICLSEIEHAKCKAIKIKMNNCTPKTQNTENNTKR